MSDMLEASFGAMFPLTISATSFAVAVLVAAWTQLRAAWREVDSWREQCARARSGRESQPVTTGEPDAAK